MICKTEIPYADMLNFSLGVPFITFHIQLNSSRILFLNKNVFPHSQQLFRSQNPANNSGIPGQPSGAPQLQQTLPQYLQNAAAYAAAAQQPYVINPGQEVPPPYMGLIPGMPQYYHNMGPWSMYPIPQPNPQPRRPLTPSQPGAESQYQVRFFRFLFCIQHCEAL